MSCIIPQPSKATDGEAPVSKKGCCAPSADARPGVVEEHSGLLSGADPRDRMIEMQGGTFLMGTDYAEAFPDDGEGPIREVTLDPFWIDRYPVTNELFSQFVEATAYRTEAERFGWSFVFWAHIPKERFYELVVDTVAAAPWWCKVPGANWRNPEGPGSAIKSRGNHPVVHVSWNDALSFCEWSGQRLPTEAEWEYAARGGLIQKLYPWGDKLRPDGEHRCNIWQGEFPRHDTGDDGYTGTCPVDAFPPNGYGLYSATGNTWEWCADWFSTDFHLTGSRINPTGPESGENKVMKGGSFLCHKSYCNRYRVAARSSNTPDSSTSHMSFRCARYI
ncbi:formylglycine-generating enzyme family protein [Terriglobus albidus]|uniref:Formylglycine-generating enzyme family protein n=1 Tax=Terriglobus albidus TaxID=1592106 RepID=A0A5B9EBB1_9BACT|nr:formylglycine-generating enzyme family protein [Terriglobus albidus]QEE27557.1 formylglycine-generating enzyme family protein [Terriglobus albidus]